LKLVVKLITEVTQGIV